MVTDEMVDVAAKAAWLLRRYDEDRSDMELEDIGGRDSSVWLEAKAALEAALSAAEPVEQDENPMRFFADNVDNWGALEWFNRLVDACEDHDRKRTQAFRCADPDEKDMLSLSADTSKMIMSSSAFRLAREHKDEIRSALSAQVQDESEIVNCLTSGKPFVFDPATNFCHAADGGAPEHGIKYVPAAQVQDVAGSEGAKAITAERRRQIEKEGWSPDHDDKYTNGELLEAAVCYALHNGGELDDAPGAWPWSRDFWKPTTRQRDLEKAGALIAAELDRVIRAAAPAKLEG